MDILSYYEVPEEAEPRSRLHHPAPLFLRDFQRESGFHFPGTCLLAAHQAPGFPGALLLSAANRRNFNHIPRAVLAKLEDAQANRYISHATQRGTYQGRAESGIPGQFSPLLTFGTHCLSRL